MKQKVLQESIEAHVITSQDLDVKPLWKSFNLKLDAVKDNRFWWKLHVFGQTWSAIDQITLLPSSILSRRKSKLAGIALKGQNDLISTMVPLEVVWFETEN